jgi:chemotaxis protein histidine kinase CheA
LKADAEAKAREEARLKAEAEAKRLAEEKRVAEEKAAAEAKLREEARIKAEAEAKTRDEARLKAEADAKRLAEEKRVADEKAKVEAEARAKAEAEAKAQAAARVKAEAEAKATTTTAAPIQLASNLKTKITNVDVVNRSLDRSQMTIGVEYEYQDSFAKPLLGVEVTRLGDPQAAEFFKSAPAEIGKSRRNFVLLPVKFQPSSSDVDSISTDKVLVYLSDGAQKLNLFPATMLLSWRAPGKAATAATTSAATSTVQLDDFKQNDLFSGYVTVKFKLDAPAGKVRARIIDSNNPKSSEWFESEDVDVKSGNGLQIIKFSVRPDAGSASDLFNCDTIEISLLDNSGKVLSSMKKQTSMRWAKPK